MNDFLFEFFSIEHAYLKLCPPVKVSSRLINTFWLSFFIEKYYNTDFVYTKKSEPRAQPCH